MNEQLSALVDAESPSESESSSLLGRMRTEEQLRDSWDVYHLIGDALRGTTGAGIDRAQFAARLGAEPTVIAPAASRPTPERVRSRGTRWAMPVAASVAAVAFVGWMASTTLLTQPANLAKVSDTAAPAKVGVLASPETSTTVPATASAPVVTAAPSGPAVVAAPAIVLPPAVIPVANGVDDYLWAHQRFAPAAHAYRVRPARHEGR